MDYSKPKVMIDLAEYEHLKECEQMAATPSSLAYTELYRTCMGVMINALAVPHRLKLIDYMRAKGMKLDKQPDNTYIIKPL